jgi:hypothetical protein
MVNGGGSGSGGARGGGGNGGASLSKNSGMQGGIFAREDKGPIAKASPRPASGIRISLTSCLMRESSPFRLGACCSGYKLSKVRILYS